MKKGSKSILTTLVVVLVMSSPLGQLTALSRGWDAGEGQDSKKQKSPAKGKDDAEKLTHSERAFLKLKQESKDHYQKDPEFRDEVDEAYRHLERDHSEFAYYINTRDRNDTQVTFSGDRLKVRDTLYDNPLAQDYVNRLGHSLTPAGSSHLYAFKITMDPIPEARSLSTGTVYCSTGLISAADNEAQLAYVLAHEIAHIEREHWLEDVQIERWRQHHNEKQEEKRAIANGLGAFLAGPVARLAGAGPLNALLATELVQMGLPTLLKIAVPDAVFTWDKEQEDEADKLAIQYMLNRNYDPREAPKFYANLNVRQARDSRARLGFMARAARISERAQAINAELGGLPAFQLSSPSLMAGATDVLFITEERRVEQQMAAKTQAYLTQFQVAQASPPATPGKSLNVAGRGGHAVSVIEQEIQGPEAAAIQAKVNAGELIGTQGEFLRVMSELKRDNGVRAYYYDMFQVSRDDLKESLDIRSDDPLAHFYYAKVLKLTAKNTAEKQAALNEFVAAIDYDKRRAVPEARLHHALAVIEMADPSQQTSVVSELKDYILLYQREHGGALPPNMDVIYDYMQDAGEVAWWASPTTNISNQDLAPINIRSGPRVETVAQPSAPAAASEGSGSKGVKTGGRRRN
jgi:hypothetical protein